MIVGSVAAPGGSSDPVVKKWYDEMKLLSTWKQPPGRLMLSVLHCVEKKSHHVAETVDEAPRRFLVFFPVRYELAQKQLRYAV